MTSPGAVGDAGLRVENNWSQGTGRDQTKGLNSPGSKRQLLVSIQHPSESPVVMHGAVGVKEGLKPQRLI